MKIVLINPNFEGSLESKRSYIPLGLAYIAAVVRESKRHEFKVIDAAALEMSDKRLTEELKKFKPDFIALGAVTDLMEASVRVCNLAKKLGIKTILGGVHPTILPRETLAFENIDFVVIGEGEYTILDILDTFEKKGDIKDIKGIAYKKDGKIVINKPRPAIENLDELPFPARDLFPWRLYSSFSSIVRKTPTLHMMTSRGCPFKCTFCASQSLWKTCRARSPKNIVDEMEELVKKFGIKEIYLFDDTFNLNIKRAEEICDEIINRKLKIALRVQARVAPLTKRLLKKLKKAGCWCIYFGVESGNNVVLKDIKKYISVDQVKEAFKMTNEAGIRTFGFFMIGLPKDDKKTIKETLKLALDIDPDFVNFAILIVYPGTEIYELAINEKSIKRIKGGEFFIPTRYSNKQVTDEELESELTNIYKKFYMRPKYMIRRFVRIRTFTEFKANVISGLPMLKGKNPFIVAKKWISND